MTVRSFLAFPISGEFKEMLESMLNELKSTHADVKWVKPENLHLTLKFLGDIQESRITEILSVLKDRCRSFAPITSYLRKFEIFPDLRHPRIVWGGLDDPNNEFKAMVEILEGELGKFGIAKEEHPFRPHITLGRVKSSRHLGNLVKAIEQIKCEDKIKQTFENIVFTKSTLTPQGPLYETLGIL